MTSGIYQLNFKDTCFYVGQSINIESRLSQHLDKFRKGTAAKKMQDAYYTYGVPHATILITCHKDYLDMMENYYIHQNRKYTGSLNTSAPALDPSVDYAWILENRSLLEHGQYIVLKELDKTHSAKIDLTNELKTLHRNSDAKAIEARARVEASMERDQNAQYSSLYPTVEAAYRHTQAALTKLHNRGILQRIFNYD